MNFVRLEIWHQQCADGCCDEYGTILIINGEEITRYYEGSQEELEKILKSLNVKYHIDSTY